ncbi:hypothetical protein [Occultella gossypii]|uniref:Uncharacterized protein n=1 Tax=Occultella gossypii TaxID=2800820 RepID=A0ABS7SDH8_9MICO|nr:hypothetical protein [Occultella gossypii]MBZ2198392.1 hypothetical protein [Occultella gossypii]
MSTPPVKTAVRGPIILTVTGAVVLIAAIVIGVIVVRLFLSVLPLGLVGSDGGPGPDAAGGAEVPGTLTLDLEADSTYVVLLSYPSNAPEPELSDSVTVIGPDGEPAAPAAGASLTVTTGGVSARDIEYVQTGAAGPYTIEVPPLADPAATPWARIVVAEVDALPGFFAGVAGSIAGVFLVFGLGIAGVAMVIGGAVWWSSRARAGRAQAAGPGQGGYPSGRFGP